MKKKKAPFQCFFSSFFLMCVCVRVNEHTNVWRWISSTWFDRSVMVRPVRAFPSKIAASGAVRVKKKRKKSIVRYSDLDYAILPELPARHTKKMLLYRRASFFFLLLPLTPPTFPFPAPHHWFFLVCVGLLKKLSSDSIGTKLTSSGSSASRPMRSDA